MAETARVLAPANLRLPRPLRLRDLAGYAWVVNEDGCGFRTAIRHAFDSAHLPFNIAVEAQNADLRFSLIARGYGIGIGTRLGLASSRWRKSLQLIEVAELREPIHVWVVHRPPVGKLEQPIRLFTAKLAGCLSSLGAPGKPS
jgi:DNA-binding transcriptional LysR family regulator